MATVSDELALSSIKALQIYCREHFLLFNYFNSFLELENQIKEEKITTRHAEVLKGREVPEAFVAPNVKH